LRASNGKAGDRITPAAAEYDAARERDEVAEPGTPASIMPHSLDCLPVVVV
jgi:hypothetical protein